MSNFLPWRWLFHSKLMSFFFCQISVCLFWEKVILNRHKPLETTALAEKISSLKGCAPTTTEVTTFMKIILSSFSHMQSSRDQVPCNMLFVSYWEDMLTPFPFWMSNDVCLMLYVYQSPTRVFTIDTSNLVRPTYWWSTLNFSPTIW